MAYAIIQTGGQQHRVQKGDVIEVALLDAEIGSTTTFSEVLLLADGDKISIGTPLVAGATVTAKVVDQVKADKVVAYKFKRRKGYHRTVGHRQKLTAVEIEAIAA